ncbi:hypothetical protein [Clostridium sp. FP1]|uniref:hypothetical protein n=1 Tax=Clostridium sp. FP1 TaxID=2724076 RepID=UPI0013E94DA7|nr:hypothetical protein [Clostridium sp. FP1]MBZ9633029.1 hypothetical protein [Clostridium sp. FP1]
MFKSTKEFETAVYDILIQIRDNPNDKNVLSKLGDTNFEDALERCFNLDLINGLHMRRSGDTLNVSITGEIRISYEGLKFTENFKA